MISLYALLVFIAAAEARYIFAHYMVGIVASYTASEWFNDILLAKNMGIDAFALNIGKDYWNDQQLGLAYSMAAQLGFKLFISFDFSYWNNGDVGAIASYMQRYGTLPAQLKVSADGSGPGDRIFVSTFVGDGFSWRAVEAQAGLGLFACPFWQPNSLANNSNADCGFMWNAWPSTNNQPIYANKTTDDDAYYLQMLAGKPYMAPVSPWFFTHYAADTWNKNWLFYSDYLWQARWEQILELQPPFAQILTWNDFGEANYIGPLHPNKKDVYAGASTGAVRWVTKISHDAWRDIAKPYIAAYKAGESTPTVTKEEFVFYYRPYPKDAQCSDPVPRPTGWQFVADAVFVVALLKTPGTVIITSGANVPVSVEAQAGIHTYSAPMALGKQRFQLVRGNVSVIDVAGPLQISSACNTYNFNAFVGAGFPPKGSVQ
ncbi:glycoside hydrolase [Exidia glandulosa HHB12029]|uniref:Glycoside hydrolase n=1 Tax=Exidia glandulosa HHB12029 TaxID=1314781 RepID=A0A165B2V7_EXIGL|nr:glycoside hydrolase [Exidia glandulosa HHB12029]